MLTITDKELTTLVRYIKQHYGIDLAKKRNLIEGRLSQIMIDHDYHTFSDYMEQVFADRSGAELTRLINKLTTNHTFFMREPVHFQFLQERVLPWLADTVKNRDLRIWSAGCSSGEEPYTLAMIMQEFFGEQKKYWDTKILATDISVQVLAKAERGVYLEECLEQVPKLWQLSYFDKLDGENYTISPKIKQEVIFRILNLMDTTWPFRRRFHVIFCRNVMIYFDDKTKLALVEHFYEYLEPGGYLFIGHSESIARGTTSYRYIMPAVYRKE